jgi:hypothetical protein
MPQPTSLTLWQQYKLGDPEAFAQLYGDYVQVLYAQGLRVTPDAGLVKDCIHDLFVELWRDRQRVPESAAVPEYLAQALRAGAGREDVPSPWPGTGGRSGYAPPRAASVERSPVPGANPWAAGPCNCRWAARK